MLFVASRVFRGKRHIDKFRIRRVHISGTSWFGLVIFVVSPTRKLLLFLIRRGPFVVNGQCCFWYMWPTTWTWAVGAKLFSGGCACRKRHAHYTLHSLRLSREHDGTGPFGRRARPRLQSAGAGACACVVAVGGGAHLGESALIGSSTHGGECVSVAGSTGAGGSQRPSPQASLRGEAGHSDIEGESSSDDGRTLQDELLLLLSSRRPRGWTASSARLCQQGALRARPSLGESEGPPEPPTCERSRPLTIGGLGASASAADCAFAGSVGQRGPAVVPIAPLELDFISGPRMGEKLVLCERVCTLGRGEGNTIQVSDSQPISVSRVHCIFEYSASRWRMRDNGSTNGTWRRLSCVLEPSDLVPLCDGVSIQAGVHEFLVEEVEMRHWWIPSIGRAALEDLLEQERREQHCPQQRQLGPTSAREGDGLVARRDAEQRRAA